MHILMSCREMKQQNINILLWYRYDKRSLPIRKSVKNFGFWFLLLIHGLAIGGDELSKLHYEQEDTSQSEVLSGPEKALKLMGKLTNIKGERSNLNNNDELRLLYGAVRSGKHVQVTLALNAIHSKGRTALSDCVNYTLAESVLLATITHDSSVKSVAWSPDGCMVCVGSFELAIVVNAFGTEMVRFKHNANEYALLITWSPGGRKICIGGEGRQVRVWALYGKEKICIGRCEHDARINAVTWSHDDSMICTCSDDKKAKVWVVKDKALTCIGSCEHDARINTVVWSHDDSMICTCSDDRKAKVWVVKDKTLTCIGSYEHDARGNAAAWSHDNSMICTCDDEKVKVW